MANEQNKNTQNQGTQNQDTQNAGASKTDFGGVGGSQNINSEQSFGGSTSGSGNVGGSNIGTTSARQAKEGGSLTTAGSGEQQSSGSSATDTAKSTARGIIDQAKDTAGQAYGVATEKATSKLEEQKTTLASGLTSVADSLKQVGGSLREADDETGITELTAKYGESLANQIEHLSDYFERRDVREMFRDIESFARRNPALFIGGAFTLGLLAARFLKSSNPQQHSYNTGGRSLNANRSINQTFDNKNIGIGSGSAGGVNTKTNPS